MWIGCDISSAMLDVALEREVSGIGFGRFCGTKASVDKQGRVL